MVLVGKFKGGGSSWKIKASDSSLKIQGKWFQFEKIRLAVLVWKFKTSDSS